MSRTLVISDIHGHVEGLELLLKLAEYAPEKDQLFLLGDFISKTPETWGALDTIRAMMYQGARALVGNTELWLVEKLRDQEITGSLEESIAFIHELPYMIQHEEYVFVHAGLRPGIRLEDQEKSDLATIREDFWGSDYVFESTVVFGHTPTYKLGTARGEIWCQPDRIGIDTGAKHGVRLTLVDLTNQLAYSCSTAEQDRYEDVRIKRLERS